MPILDLEEQQDISDTLQELKLFDNKIRVIKSEHLSGMHRLHRLYVAKNDLYKVSDIHAILPALTLFNFVKMKFSCCQRVMGLKDFDPFVLEINSAPCNYPAYLKGLDWWSITRTDLDIPCQGNDPKT
ncbi:hypothetical protein CAPTEDRAFT_195083 [Capitella teleta]|uniref:Uncharacterized protein n=1 Tax=Capitella teleta TaxID=283909 RepID=R7TRA2_CAPTE|nr:hypothetical protein CAPTEDRAFT_195083 [Capitella teleta]|eukprot:ELT96107.1 hypothetical protein CAPTEDRAFT_195083 [Capitella teleta]